MKKLLFICCMGLLLQSCVGVGVGIYNYNIAGDVTAYNADGTVLKSWDDVIIASGDNWSGQKKSAMKQYGLNFVDPDSGKGVILGNSVPYIIEYGDKKVNNTQNTQNIKKTQKVEKREDVKNAIASYQEKYDANKEKMKDPNITKAEKQLLKRENAELFNAMMELKNKLAVLY